MKKRILSMLLALAMLLSLVPTAVLAVELETEDALVYVSIGDSMTNGYGLDGYDGSSGIVNYANGTYGNQFAAWLAGYEGEIENDQVIFEGDKGVVDHRQLAMSGLRAEDLLWVLTLDYQDEDLMKSIYDNWDWNRADNNVTWENHFKHVWFNEWGFKTGDFRTWSDFCDYNYRYADGAARILATYFHEDGNGYGYYDSDYDFSAYAQNAVDGIADTNKIGNDDGTYFPRTPDEAEEIGGYKYLQIATEFFQKSVADADIISLALGNTNFGTYMLNEIMSVTMSNDVTSFSNKYDIEDVFALAELEPELEAKVRELLVECEPLIEQVFAGLANGDADKVEALKNIVKFCVVSYLVNYIGSVEAILTLNPDVEIIQVALMNAYAEDNSADEGTTIGDVVELLYTPVNAFLAALPTYLQATGNYTEAEFYYAEADSVDCLVNVFGNDFYKKDDVYVDYPGLLNGGEELTANEKSIVRDRFVENIVRGDTFKLMAEYGIDVDSSITVADIAKYDKMLPVEKAAYAAQNQLKAKSIALYLAFENATIKAGKQNISMESLAALDNLGTAFTGLMGTLETDATAYGVANYLDSAAAVVTYGSNGALEANAVKTLVLGGDAAIYAYIAGRSGGKLTDAQVKDLYEAENQDAAIYGYVASLSNGFLDATAVKNLYDAVNAAGTDEAKKAVIYATVAGIANNDLLPADVVKALYEADDQDAAIEAYIASVVKQTMAEDQSVNQILSMSAVTNHADVDDILACAETNPYHQYCPAVQTAYKDNLDGAIASYKHTMQTAVDGVDQLKTAVNGVNSLKGVITNVDSLMYAVDSANSLCYLLGLPQILSDKMYGNSTLRGILAMNARCLIGTGIGGHPDQNGHDSLFAAVKGTYEEEYTSEQETVKNMLYLIAAYYDEAYAYAYAEAINKGYIAEAIGYLESAKAAVESAQQAVKDYAVEKNLKDVKAEMLNELDNTVATLDELIALLQSDKLAQVDAALAALLELEDDLWAHLNTLGALGLEIGFAVDPYIVNLNDAVVNYAELIETVTVDAYNWMCTEVEDFAAAYAEWVESVGAAVDTVSPELGAAVRKFLTDVPADTLAILAAYGEEALTKLFADAAAAAGDVAGVVANLAAVLVKHGETIYNAVKDNKDVQALVADVKAQLVKAEALAKEIADYVEKHPITSVTGTIAKKEALLQAAYAELVVLYNRLYDVTMSAVADADPATAAALAAALDALTEVLGITCDAAEGYLGWLADHGEAMGAALLAALLDNVDELLTTACPIIDQMIWNLIGQIEAAIPGIIEYLVDALIAFLPIADQWMYDWLYNHPYEVIAFFTEYGDEIAALAEEYGDYVVGILAYIAYTYGPEVLEFIIENPCEALDMFVDWYNKYGYRIWPMIDVYLEALGVYDAIDHQMGVVNDEIKAMLSDLDAHILAQIAALNAALKDAHDELRAQIEAEIAALTEQLKQFLKANISAYYVVGPNSYYVALGDAGAYGPAADMLAAELGMTDKYANLTVENATASVVLDSLDAFAADIEKADLITLGFGANSIIDAVTTDVTNAAFGELSEKDWAALVGAEGAAAIEAALEELTAYVAEEVGDESIATLLTVAVESFAYTYITHLVDYVVVSEAIHEINADALLVLVGMHNPLDGVVVDLDGEQLDLGEYVDYLVTLTNIYSFGYALYADNTIYVDAPDVEVDAKSYLPTEAGYKYIQEQIYNALNPTLAEEEEPHVHGAPAGDVKFIWAGDYSTCVAVYVCSGCGQTLTADCLVEILETKQPTVEEEGYVKYQATVEIAGKTYTDVQIVVLAKLDAPETGDTTMIGLYVTMMLVATAAAVVVLKKKKSA